MPKVTLSGYILVPGEDLESVKRALPAHIENTLAEKGCISIRVSQDSDDPYRFNVFEEFKDEEALAAHRQRIATSEWGVVSARAKRHYEIT